MREEYYTTSSTIRLVKHPDVDVTGIMGTSHKPEVKIVVMPKRAEDLAPALKREYDRVTKK